MLGIALVRERDDRVDAVVAAVELHDDQDAAVARGTAARAVRARKPGTVGARAIRVECSRPREEIATGRSWGPPDRWESGQVKPAGPRGRSGSGRWYRRAASAFRRASPGRRPAGDPGAPVAGPVRSPSSNSGEEATSSSRPWPRSWRPARARASNGPGRPIPVPSDQGRGEVGPADQAAGRQPGSAAGPAADVGRIEQVLAQPAAPLGQHQRAARRVEHLQGADRPDDVLDRAQHAIAEVLVGEEQRDRSTVSTAQPMSRSRARSPSARASRSAVFIAFAPGTARRPARPGAGTSPDAPAACAPGHPPSNARCGPGWSSRPRRGERRSRRRHPASTLQPVRARAASLTSSSV